MSAARGSSPPISGALCRIETTHERRSSAVVPRKQGLLVTLSVPGTLLYRQLVLRVVESMCKLVRTRAGEALPRRTLDDAVVSACSEAFNNIAIHGYREQPGDVRIEIEPGELGIAISIFDRGPSFDPAEIAAPCLDELPESGMGLYIIRSFMDDVSYHPGDPPHTPNELRMYKKLEPNGCSAAAHDKENSQ